MLIRGTFIQSFGAFLLFFVGAPVLVGQTSLTIPDDGWRLWPDREAAWENDPLYLPDEVDLDKLPHNPPTGGWSVLDASRGIDVTLPSTVEQHFWGDFGFREYKNAYWFEKQDKSVQNGNYQGVSWWYRDVEVPESFRDKTVLLRVRGARLRSEVYWNQQLVGYDMIGEVSYSCDVSQVVRPGEINRLAIRITNPGGRMDWLDMTLMSWGSYRFFASRGFGGLDRGLSLTAHDPVYIEDLWVLNTPEPRKVSAHAILRNLGGRAGTGVLRFAVIDPDKPDRGLHSSELSFVVPARGAVRLHSDVAAAGAELWDLDHPKLYRLRADFEFRPSGSTPGRSNVVWRDRRGVNFGFRWITTDGVGEDAVLRLNSRRIRLYSAISWGFWGPNGLWPDRELAERDVRAAKSFGMNCLQFHRNIGRTEVLDAHDRVGLFRFMEPGGGMTVFGRKFGLGANSPKTTIDSSGNGGEAETFAEKYMEEKIVRMIRDHRSHPSLIIYNVQNEIHPDLQNPRVFRVLRRMHEEDPSRIIICKSGIQPRNQAWMQPYDETVRHDSGDGFSGWWDKHTVGGPGVWQDEMYKSPNEFTHRSTNTKEIVVWGEMLGVATLDNHIAALRDIERYGSSYDATARKEIVDAYRVFLDRWGFRSAFESEEALFLDVGNKAYDFWGRIMETTRLAEANDFLVMSGWESIAIENHSGLLDIFRNFKGDPQLIGTRMAPVRPVIKARALVVPRASRNVLDLFLLNESGTPVDGSLRLTMFTPDGTMVPVAHFQLPEQDPDRFVYPIAEALETPWLANEGRYKLRLSVTEPRRNDEIWDDSAATVFAEEELLVVDPVGAGKIPERIGIVSDDPGLLEVLRQYPGVDARPYQQSGNYDAVVGSARFMTGWRTQVPETTEIENTADDVLYRTESRGWSENLEFVFRDLPPGKVRVTLRFAETGAGRPGVRVFDVAINGKTFLDDFDIYAAAGGRNIALDRWFEVDAPDGVVRITIPERKKNYGKFSAIKIEAADRTIAINCGGEPYEDAEGLTWQRYPLGINLDQDLLERVRAGLPLLLLPDGETATVSYAKQLAAAGAFRYLGHVGPVRASWMGGWFFVRDHPVFEGLPVDTAMKSYYQVPVQLGYGDGMNPFSWASGVLLEGDNVEIMVGYGRDHDLNIGAASFAAKLGKGTVVFHCLPGMVQGLHHSSAGMHPVLLKRLLANSLRYVAGSQPEN